MKKLLVKLIILYQRTLSPDSGWLSKRFPVGYCKYHPSCSEYCKQSIAKHGVLAGILKGAWRIVRCNPWSKGGMDPV